MESPKRPPQKAAGSGTIRPYVLKLGKRLWMETGSSTESEPTVNQALAGGGTCRDVTKIKARFLSEPRQPQIPRGSHCAFTTFPLCVRSFPIAVSKAPSLSASAEQRLLGQTLGRIDGWVDFSRQL